MRKVAIIPSIVGYHWEEVYGAYKEFKNAGWTIDLFTVNGQSAVPDPKSLEKRPILSMVGLGLNDSISPQTILGKELNYRLNYDILSINELNADNYDALYIPGGHGCLFDVNVNNVVQRKVIEAYQRGKTISAVCHGSSLLAFTFLNGRSILKGKKVTGFPDFIDNLLLFFNWIPKKFLPLPYKNEKTMKEAGADISWINTLLSIVNPYYKRIDGRLITGMGPKASYGVARKVIEMAEQKEEVISEEVLL